jgi:hypothetical protein
VVSIVATAASELQIGTHSEEENHNEHQIRSLKYIFSFIISLLYVPELVIHEYNEPEVLISPKSVLPILCTLPMIPKATEARFY